VSIFRETLPGSVGGKTRVGKEPEHRRRSAGQGALGNEVSRRSTNRSWMLALRLACALFPLSAAGQAVTEDQVKAAYLLNFAKFVEWPEGAVSEVNLHFCTLGSSAVADELDATIRGKAIDGHPIDVRRLDKVEEANNCHLVYLAATAGKQQKKLLEMGKGRPMLLVGDGGAFASAGGTIGFVIEKGRVLFEINVKSADESRLKISSRLLALARIIDSREERQHRP
jgi:hypothetical protein